MSEPQKSKILMLKEKYKKDRLELLIDMLLTENPQEVLKREGVWILDHDYQNAIIEIIKRLRQENRGGVSPLPPIFMVIDPLDSLFAKQAQSG